MMASESGPESHRATGASPSSPKWRPSPENHRALEPMGYGKPGVSLHLAIMREPHYTNLLSGVKKWETRVTKNRIEPFEQVKRGDIILWKPTGKNGNRASKVLRVVSATRGLDGGYSDDLVTPLGVMDRETFLAVDSRIQRDDYHYVTFVRVTNPTLIGEFRVEKRDRRAWVVLEER